MFAEAGSPRHQAPRGAVAAPRAAGGGTRAAPHVEAPLTSLDSSADHQSLLRQSDDETRKRRWVPAPDGLKSRLYGGQEADGDANTSLGQTLSESGHDRAPCLRPKPLVTSRGFANRSHITRPPTSI